MKSFVEFAQNRYSCRSFSTQKVENEKIEACLAAANISPSACNSQPWRFIVVTNEELIQKLAEQTQLRGANKFMNDVPAVVAFVQQKSPRYNPGIVEWLGDGRFSDFDTGLCAAHFIFQASELGLGTCMVGGMGEAVVAELLGLSESEKMLVMIAIGYPLDAPREKKRVPVEEKTSYIK